MDSPIKNYREIKKSLQLLEREFKSERHILNEKTIEKMNQWIDFVESRNLVEEAHIEIDNLIYTGYNDQNPLKRGIWSNYQKFSKFFLKIEKVNKITADTSIKTTGSQSLNNFKKCLDNLYGQLLDYIKDDIEFAVDSPEILAKAKFYALNHLVRVHLGIEKNFKNPESKKEIEDYAVRNYRFKDGQAFYKAYRDIDIKRMDRFVLSLSQQDRSNWKKIIRNLSGSNAEVVKWLTCQPN